MTTVTIDRNTLVAVLELAETGYDERGYYLDAFGANDYSPEELDEQIAELEARHQACFRVQEILAKQ